MSTEHLDRFDASRYSQDVPARITLMLDSRVRRATPSDVWLGERLLHRLRHLALAHEMPLLSRLPSPNGKWFYPDEQLESLSDEGAFELSVVNDPLLESTLAEPGNFLQPRGSGRGGWSPLAEAP